MTFLCNADGRYGGRDRAGVRENGREADRDRDAPRSRAEANGRKDAEVRCRTFHPACSPQSPMRWRRAS